MDELRRAVRGAADAHRPDTVRMRERVERGMERRAAGGSPFPHSWPRVAAAAAAVASVVAVTGVAVAVALRDDAPARPPVATSAPPPATTASPPADGRTPDASPSTPKSGHSPSRAPVTGASDAPVTAAGSLNQNSNDYWAQHDVTLEVTRRLTALTVELRVARTAGVASNGAWNTLNKEDFTADVHEAGEFLVYRWTLKEGRTVPAGRHVFAGQFNHAPGGRTAAGDRYTVTGRAQDAPFTLSGGFTPAS
ncbi:hypothetical protein SRB5_04340 [Streptomyces sp. RB5]|uniref:Uncharacterized protein n=1 Tax=Streptomyces smaragdinus TaxID=2585196 RepID=A0A7K0CA43_9ACTN|nr:hypothetical protein [Streptomyces smaragdinus]MQY10327.1 hypothetical protein [Streptomyces smaragdinus]